MSLTFGPHVQQVCQKAERTIEIFARNLLNIEGPKGSRRRVLAQVVNSRD